jgi:hypothetical protein
MGASYSIFTLLFALLSGGASDILDLVPSDAYWKAKNVTVTVDQLIGELKTAAGADLAPLIAKLGSGNYAQREEAAKKIIEQGPPAIAQLEKSYDDPDPEVANRAKSLVKQIRLNSKAANVRRLMAIRTLGEMKKAEALPALQALANSKDPFVPDYAARAIAQIQGKPLPLRGASPEALKTDLSLLPANCGIVGQLAFRASNPIPFEEIIKQVPPMPGENREQTLKQLTDGVIALADQVGNIRVEAITFGVADTVGPNDGFAIAIVRGQYDAPAVSAMIHNLFPNSQSIEGAEVYSPDDHTSFAFASDDRAISMVGAAQNKLPMKDLLAAARQNKGPLLTNPDIAKLIQALPADPDVRAWAVCKVSDSYRMQPQVAAFDTITLTGRQNKDSLDLRIAGEGPDANKVAAAVDQINNGISQAKTGIAQAAQNLPMLKPINDFVQAMKCEAEGKTATLTSTLKGDATMLIAIPMMGFGVQAQPQVAPPAAAAGAPPGAPPRSRNRSSANDAANAVILSAAKDLASSRRPIHLSQILQSLSLHQDDRSMAACRLIRISGFGFRISPSPPSDPIQPSPFTTVIHATLLRRLTLRLTPPNSPPKIPHINAARLP